MEWLHLCWPESSLSPFSLPLEEKTRKVRYRYVNQDFTLYTCHFIKSVKEDIFINFAESS